MNRSSSLGIALAAALMLPHVAGAQSRSVAGLVPGRITGNGASAETVGYNNYNTKMFESLLDRIDQMDSRLTQISAAQDDIQSSIANGGAAAGSGNYGSPECYYNPHCPPFWVHRGGVFADFLYLSARDVDMPYATPVDGIGQNAVPIGATRVIDPDYQPGVRIGARRAMSDRSTIAVAFTHFESDTNDGFSLPGGTGFIRADTVHPNTQNVAADGLSATADYDIDFELVDLTFQRMLLGGCSHRIDYVVGLRYARLEQDFGAGYFINGATAVTSEIDFDGVGPRLGLDGQWLLGRGFLVYSNAFANFLAGEFRADYRQANVFVGQQARAGLDDDRIVSLLELELGMGWQSRCGRLRLTAGYYIGSWFNAMTTPQYIDAVQADDVNDIDEILTFDGLRAGAEVRF